MTDIQVVVTASGPVPTPPAVLEADLIAAVAATTPGYTILPAGLIEDVASTDVGALIVCDTARVETINSLTPLGSNPFLTLELGQIYIGPGAAPAVPTNTSVYVLFNAQSGSPLAPLPGYVLDRGFVVGDGTYQYIVQDGGATAADGTVSLFCEASNAGTWAVPTNSVTQIATSVPSNVTLTCTNPVAGISGGPAETEEQYRARVLQAGQAISTGTATLLKTLLGNVPGVQQRLISVVQTPGGPWEVIVGGGDPYQVAYAIYKSGLNIAGLTGSTLAITGITQANPGKITTALNHGYSDGQIAQASGIVGMTPLNGIPFTVTVIDEKNFTIGINTLGYPSYVSGGVLTPNLRNVTPNLLDPPDIYAVPFVNPPQQTVTMAVTWSTTALNFISAAAIAQAAAPALAAYVNAIIVGAPTNLLVMGTVFSEAIADILDPSQISALNFAISINGVATAPEVDTDLVFGDPESFFEATVAGIAVTQG